MKSVQLNLTVELNKANDGQPTSKGNQLIEAGSANQQQLRIVHSVCSRSLLSQKSNQVTNCSKALEIVAKLRRKTLRMANAKALTPNITKIFSRSYNNTHAKKYNENIAKHQLGKPNRNPHVVYEERKRQWDQQHPDAKPEQRDAAMTRIARECGV